MNQSSTVLSSSCLLEMRGITKHFPGVTALDGVDLSVNAGEIHALIGQNGAGKSTLMNVLAGMYQPDAGEIMLGGQAVRFQQPRAALQCGIGIVYQDRSLVPLLSVADNIFLGREAGGGVLVNQKDIETHAERILDDLGVSGIDVRQRVVDLPLARQQLVEIAKVLSHEPRILVLDEPTAALAEEETTHLMTLLRGLKARGIAIIYISHRFKEIIAFCDRATVLRNGRLVKTINISAISEMELIELTIGERVDAFFGHNRHQQHTAHDIPALEVEQLSVGRSIRDVSFQLYRGEILGITGLLGAGQNELVRALFGLMLETSGVIRRDGNVVQLHSPASAIRYGIGLLTEHRKTEGLVLSMDVSANLTLASLPLFRRWMAFIDQRKERQRVGTMTQQMQIKTATVQSLVSTLSGGNQQKVILGKWLLRDLDVLIFISPTQGIDVGAKAEIYAQLTELAALGKAILIVSEDLVEIIGISDRIMVMYQGRHLRTVPRIEATEERLLAAIQGSPQ